MIMTGLSLATIENQTTSSNLERGKSYFNSGQVSNFKITNNRFVQAIVNGTKNYKVFLEAVDGSYRGFCSCPYNSKGYCKHQVAVKLALMKVPDQAEILFISKWEELFLKLYNRLLHLFYLVKYKRF
jgi:uncharacterized Zn finger protein